MRAFHRFVLPAIFVVACRPGTTASAPSAALEAITSDGLMGPVKALSSDGMEGRSPGTRGEDSAVAYIEAQFKALGLQPGNPVDGSYIQKVGLIGFTSTPTGSFTVKGKTIALHAPDDFVATSRHDKPTIDVKNSELVFVGYGVSAPEYGWDDYKGVDLKGKTVVMLINDPAIPSPADSTKLDDAMFRGKAMTYYGRWTYKYEIASLKGADAAIIVHETGPAAYPFSVVQGSWGHENFDIDPPNPGRVLVEGWITSDKAAEVFAAAGQDFQALKRAALRKDFTPVPLGGSATFHVTNHARRVQSRNVVARLDGSDAEGKKELVVYSAHWDHLGRDTTAKGDGIFNGAADNASGVSVMLSIAKAFTALPTPPRRTVLFLAVTAEERNLLGAKFYAEHPLYPLAQTAADINMDGFNQWGRTKDIVIVGMGASTMDDELVSAATAGGRVVVPDPEPEKGFFFRSDQFELAKQGVPVLYTDSGIDYIGKPANYGITKRDEYTTNDYHKPSDEVKPDWDLSGAVDDTRLLFQVGYGLATSTRWPDWKAGAEFKARRDETIAVRAGAR